MICPACHGKGRTQRMFAAPICHDCGGTGFAHCCEGADASCEVDEEAKRTPEQEAWGEWRRRNDAL